MPTFPRKGVPITVSLDPDANELLRAMVKNRQALGLMLSELVRKEARERAERPELLDLLSRHERERLRLQEVLAKALAETVHA